MIDWVLALCVWVLPTVLRPATVSGFVVLPKRWVVERHWRAARAVFFNYGIDTGTVWKSALFQEPIRWRYARRASLAFSALARGHDGECPCCRQRFADAG